MNTQSLTAKLLELPQEIADLQLELLTLGQRAQEISNQIVKCETRLRGQIASETDDTGKKKHSNEDSRRAAFAELAEADLELTELKTNSSAVEKELQLKKIDFDCLINEQKNVRTILIFLSGKSE